MQLANVKQMLLAGQKIRRMGRWMDGPDVRLASVGDNVAFSVGEKLLRQGK